MFTTIRVAQFATVLAAPVIETSRVRLTQGRDSRFLAAAQGHFRAPAPFKGRKKPLDCGESAPDALIAWPMTHRKETTMGIRSAWAARFIRSIAPVACIAAALSAQTARAGTWTRLTNNAPGAVNLMILLSDGTVMALASDGSAVIPSGWYKLTPDIQGSYVNGTWTTL